MNSMAIVGLGWWAVAGIFGTLFQYECLNVTTVKGLIFKSIAAFCVIGYAITLIVMYGEPTDAAINLVLGLVFVTIADIVDAYLELKGDGTSKSLMQALSGENTKKLVILGIAGVLYICSYFAQTVAFVKGLSKYADVTEYAVPFLVIFLLPIVFTLVGGVLVKVQLPENEIRIVIIGIFYTVLGSALFSASTVFAFALFEADILHAIWVFLGTFLFFIALLVTELRYSNPEEHDNKLTRVASRLFTFLGRMILAGCAFML